MSEDLKWSNYDFTKIPFDNIVSVGQRTLLYRDLFTVSWLLGRFCNYRCSYCWPYARSDRKDHRPTELCLLTVDEIKRQARLNGFNSFHFSLSGGEPTFHPGYLDILKHLADDVENTNYTSIHMTSNCSRPMKWFEQYVDYAKPFHRASITASLHTEHVNTIERMEEFANKLILCQENDVQITINMVMVPEWFERDWENALYFHSRGINVTLKPQSDPTASRVVDGYTKEQLERLTDKEIISIPFWVNQENLFHIDKKINLRKKYGFKDDDYIIGSFQRDTEGSDLLSPKLIKGPDIFVDLVNRLNKTKNIKILLSGTRRQYVINNLEKHEIPYEYFEMVQIDQLNEFYNILDLYLVSSRLEGGPQAVLECAATKTPIISTDVGVASEILHPNSIYSLDNFEDAEPMVEHAYENSKKFMLPEGMNRFREMFREIYES